MIGSAFFLGWTIFAIAIPRMGDLYGRRLVYLTSMAIQAPCIYTLMVSHSLYLTIAMLFMMGAMSAGRVSVGFLYIQEMVPAKMRSLTGTLFALCDACTMVLATLYFEYITHNSIYWEATACILNVVSVIMVFFIVPESPKWLYEKGLYLQAKQSLLQIAQGNKVHDSQLIF